MTWKLVQLMHKLTHHRSATSQHLPGQPLQVGHEQDQLLLHFEMPLVGSSRD